MQEAGISSLNSDLCLETKLCITNVMFVDLYIYIYIS